MTNPTRAEMAALVDELRNEAVFDPAKRAAAALIEALMQERAEPDIKAMMAQARKNVQPLIDAARRNELTPNQTVLALALAQAERELAEMRAAPPAKPAGELPPLPKDGESNAPPIVGTSRR